MEERQIVINNLEVNYKYLLNEEKKHTIVILHWWWWSSDSWVEAWKLLQESWYNVYVPDLPWFGKTKINKTYTLDDYAQLITNFIIELRLKNIILWWHSNWWAISTKIVNSWNIDITRLILNNSAWIRNDKKRTLKRKIFNTITSYVKKIKPKPKSCWRKCKVLKFFRTCFYKMIWWHDYLNAEKNPYLKQTYLNMIQSDLQDEISKIEINTLLIRWEKDTYTPLSDWIKIRNLIKNSKMITLENQKHWIHIHAPKLLIESFINNI
jgi:pimeloyl-ACP methyl ester carboxylesterase